MNENEKIRLRERCLEMALRGIASQYIGAVTDAKTDVLEIADKYYQFIMNGKQ